MKFLSDRKERLRVIPAILIFFVSVIFLTSCTVMESNTPGSFSEAASQGIIMTMEDAQLREDIHELAAARLGMLGSSANFDVGLYFPIQSNMHFEHDTGQLALFVENGRVVQEGEELALLSFDNERIEIDRIQAEIRLQQFNQNTANDAARRRNEITNAQFYADHAHNERDLTRLLLNLSQLEQSYQRFRFETSNTRRQLTEELAELQSLTAGEHMLAPFSGTVRNAYPLKYDTFEGRRPQILTLIDEDVFFFTISVNQHRPELFQRSPAGILSYGDVVTIQSHSAVQRDGPPELSFEARVVTDPWAAGRRYNFTFWLVPVDMPGFIAQLHELDPYDWVQALHSIAARGPSAFQTSISFTIADYGVVIPTAAIGTRDRRFFVFVYENGNLTRRFIQPGAQFVTHTHVISGIDPGEMVVILP